jgi:hypothetical protein
VGEILRGGRSRLAWAALASGVLMVSVVAGPSVAGASTGDHGSFSNLTWKFGPDIPKAHLEGGVVAVKSSIYDISGAVSDCSDGVPGVTTADVQIYDPATAKFSAGAPIPDPRQEDPAAVAIGRNIYVVGGTVSCGGAPVAAVDVYSTKHNKWKTLPAASDLPAGLQAGWVGCGAAIGKNLYFFSTTSVGILDTSGASPTWTVDSLPSLTPTDFCDAARVGHDIFIVNPGDGGADAYAQRVFEFNPKTATVTEQSETTIAFAEESVGVIHRRIVLAGGDFGGNTSVQIITPSKHSVATASTALPDYRDDAQGGSVVKNKMYIIGGQSLSGGTMPRVMIGTPN